MLSVKSREYLMDVNFFPLRFPNIPVEFKRFVLGFSPSIQGVDSHVPRSHTLPYSPIPFLLPFLTNCNFFFTLACNCKLDRQNGPVTRKSLSPTDNGVNPRPHPPLPSFLPLSQNVSRRRTLPQKYCISSRAAAP